MKRIILLVVMILTMGLIPITTSASIFFTDVYENTVDFTWYHEIPESTPDVWVMEIQTGDLIEDNYNYIKITIPENSNSRTTIISEYDILPLVSTFKIFYEDEEGVYNVHAYYFDIDDIGVDVDTGGEIIIENNSFQGNYFYDIKNVIMTIYQDPQDLATKDTIALLYNLEDNFSADKSTELNTVPDIVTNEGISDNAQLLIIAGVIIITAIALALARTPIIIIITVITSLLICFGVIGWLSLWVLLLVSIILILLIFLSIYKGGNST